MQIDIKLRLQKEPLLSRKCYRCSGTEFRAIKFVAHESSENYNPNFSSIIEPHQAGGRASQTSLPLAICIQCHRIVTLI